MNIERYPAGPLDTNGYVVSKDGHCLVVDPSLNSLVMIEEIKSKSLVVDAILLTHSHFDHYLGMHEVLEAFGAIPIYLHDDERAIIADPDKNLASWIGRSDSFTGETVMYNEGENKVAEFEFSAIFCPGHTPGGVSLLFGNDCITGDTLFNNSAGRTDFEYSSASDLMDSINNKLFALPDETTIWPGHGFNSTIGAEKQHNPYVR